PDDPQPRQRDVGDVRLAWPPGHGDAQVFDEAPAPLPRAVERGRAGAAEWDPVEAELGAGRVPAPGPVGRVGAEPDHVTEDRAVELVEDPVPVEILAIDLAVAAATVRARVAGAVGAAARLGHALLVP